MHVNNPKMITRDKDQINQQQRIFENWELHIWDLRLSKIASKQVWLKSYSESLVVLLLVFLGTSSPHHPEDYLQQSAEIPKQ